MKIQTDRGNNIVTMVNELINLVDLTWDVDLVRSILWPVGISNLTNSHHLREERFCGVAL